MAVRSIRRVSDQRNSSRDYSTSARPGATTRSGGLRSLKSVTSSGRVPEVRRQHMRGARPAPPFLRRTETTRTLARRDPQAARDHYTGRFTNRPALGPGMERSVDIATGYFADMVFTEGTLIIWDDVNRFPVSPP